MLRRAIIWAFQVLLLCVPFAFTAINDELFEFNKMLLTYAVTSLIAGLWIARMIHERRRIWRTTLLGWAVLAYWVAYALTTLFSIHLSTSVFGYYSRFHGGLLSITAYTVVYFAAVSNLHRRDLPRLIVTHVLAATAVALYAIPEHFGWSPSCSLIEGSLDHFNTTCWSEENNPFYRVFGTFGQPNWLAAYLVTSIPTTLWLWWHSLTERSAQSPAAFLTRHWPLLASTVMILAIVYTKSRSGIIALALATGWLFVTAWGVPLWSWLRPSAQRSAFPPPAWRPALFAASSFAVIVGVLLVMFGTPWHSALAAQWWNRLQSATAPSGSLTDMTAAEPVAPASGTVLETGGTESGEIRKIVWRGAWEIWRHSPLLGSGPETFAYSYYRYRPLEHNLVSEWDFLYNKAHNEFLNTLATRGLAGFFTELGLMTTFVGSILWYVWQHRSQHSATVWFGLCLLGSYGALAVTNFFGFSTVMVGVLFFLLPAWWDIIMDSSTDQVDDAVIQHGSVETRWDEPQPIWVAYAVVAAGVLYIWVLLWTIWQNDILLAQTKDALFAGDGATAYQSITTLTQRAPNESVYWEQRGLTLARLAVATAPEDATTAAILAEDAITSADTALQLNPVHINMWKSKARVYLSLSTLNSSFLEDAAQVLEESLTLAPTDAKLPYNLALIYTALDQPELAEQYYRRTIELKPNYEEARNLYGEFLQSDGRLEEAAAQYRYILEHLNPQAPTAQSELLDITQQLATQSAQPSPR